MGEEIREVGVELRELTERLRKVFVSESGFEKMKKYISGLIGKSERKNGWQLSEYIGESTPYTLQQFIYRGKFSFDVLRDVLGEYVSENLGEENGIP